MSIPTPAFDRIPANSANTWIGRGLKKTAIVNHTQGGFYAGTISWFQDPAAQASANYVFAMDGRVTQMVDPFGVNAPFANGGILNPDAEFLAWYATNGRQNPNFTTISFEHEDMRHTVQITDYPSMFEASTLMAAWLCQEFGIDPNAPGSFMGHYQIDSVNRPYCPGWTAATWDAYITEVNRKLTGPSVAPPPVITMEQKVEMLWGLLGANGWNVTRNPGGSLVPEGWKFGDEAVLPFHENKASFAQAIFDLQYRTRNL